MNLEFKITKKKLIYYTVSVIIAILLILFFVNSEYKSTVTAIYGYITVILFLSYLFYCFGCTMFSKFPRESIKTFLLTTFFLLTISITILEHFPLCNDPIELILDLVEGIITTLVTCIFGNMFLSMRVREHIRTFPKRKEELDELVAKTYAVLDEERKRREQEKQIQNDNDINDNNINNNF